VAASAARAELAWTAQALVLVLVSPAQTWYTRPS
jgi:hypothetical protein